MIVDVHGVARALHVEGGSDSVELIIIILLGGQSWWVTARLGHLGTLAFLRHRLLWLRFLGELGGCQTTGILDFREYDFVSRWQLFGL